MGLARQGERPLRAGRARLRDRLSQRAKRAAPRPYEIARKRYRSLRPRRSTQPLPSASLQLPPTDRVRDSYDAISKLNIVDNVAKVTLAFYERLGLNPQQSPVYRCLASIRSQLAEEVEARGAISTGSSLERFELGMARLRGRRDP